MDCTRVSRGTTILLILCLVGTFHAALLPTATTIGQGLIGVTIPTKPTLQESCEDLTSLYNSANSECKPDLPREIVAVNYNNEANSWHVRAVGTRVIVKALINEKDATLIQASPWHDFVISSSSSSLVIPFQAPSRKTQIPFPNPFNVPPNSTNITITVRKKRSGETLNMRLATITLFGIPAAKNCSATNCLDAVSKWFTAAANTIKRCQNDSNNLRYRYNVCFEPPEIITPPTKQQVKFGARVTLLCRAEAAVTQDLKYTWYKDNKPLTGGNRGSFVIPSAKLQDQGSYKCQVSTRYNSVISEAAEVIIFKKGQGLIGVTIPTKPTLQESCEDLASLYNSANSECNPDLPREIVAVNYNNETNSWHVRAVGTRVIVKAFINENDVTLIQASPWHDFVISSSSSSLVVPFQAPSKKTPISFPNPFNVPPNSTNITITVRKKRSGETLNMRRATVSLFGIPAAKNCSATNCLDAVSKWLTAANAIKRCQNDSNHLEYRYNECFEQPEIITPPRKQRVKFGARVTLLCRAKVAVTQDLKYTWYKDNKPLTGGNGSFFVIPSAKQQDQGSYKCQVSTRYNSVISEAAEVIILKDIRAKTVLVLSVSRNKNKTTEPQIIANSIKSYLNSAGSKWKFDVQFSKIRESSKASTTVELVVYSLIDPEEVKSYYSQEQQLIEKGARKNSFNGFKLYRRKIQMESSEYCLAETTGRTNLKGLFPWPLTAVGNKINISCPYGPTGVQAQRSCIVSLQSRGEWTVTDDSECSFRSKTTEGLQKLTKNKISKSNANEVVKETKRLTQGVAADEMNTADIAFVADIIDKVLSAGAITSTGQDVVEIINSVMAANDSVLADGQKSKGIASKFVRLIDAIAENIPIVPGESTRTLAAPNLVIQAAESDGSNFEGRSFASSTAKLGEKEGLSKVAISSRELPADQTQTGISLPSSISEKFQAVSDKPVRIAFALYQNTKFFQTVEGDEEGENGEVSKSWIINSRVISGSVAGMTLRHLSEPVVTTFQPIKSSDLYPVCVFWNFSANGGLGNWSTEGCKFVGNSSGRITCHCNHMTNFAVLFSAHGPRSPVNPDVPHTLALSYISYIGCGISLLGVLLTLLTYAMFRTLRKSISQHILMSLCIALALLLVVFIVGAHRLGGLPGCRVVAALLHYLVLTVVLWMGVEGYHLYLNVVQVLATYQKSFMLKVSIIAWGVPAIIVGITLATSMRSYGDDYYCVLTGNPFYGALFAPALLILAANFIIFFCVMCKLLRDTQSEAGKVKEDKSSNIRSRWRTGVAIMVLLGLTWLFGALAIGRAKMAFEYLFSIFNSLQGLFIFIFYCVMRSEVRKKWREYYLYKKTGNYTLTDIKLHASSSNGSSSMRRIRGRSNNSETNLIPSKLYKASPGEIDMQTL